MLRDRRAPHPEMSRNRVDRAIGLDEEIEHRAPHGTANFPKDIRLAIGSHHDASQHKYGKPYGSSPKLGRPLRMCKATS